MACLFDYEGGREWHAFLITRGADASFLCSSYYSCSSAGTDTDVANAAGLQKALLDSVKRGNVKKVRGIKRARARIRAWARTEARLGLGQGLGLEGKD